MHYLIVLIKLLDNAFSVLYYEAGGVQAIVTKSKNA